MLAAQTPKPKGATAYAPEVQFKKVTPAKRFVYAPTRPVPSTESVKDKHDGIVPGAQTQYTPRAKPRRPFERVESIEEGSQSSPASIQDEHYSGGVLPSIEHVGLFTADARDEDEDEDEDMLFESAGQNKRRRMSPPSSPSQQPRTGPHTPVPVQNSTTHRFKVPPPRTPGLYNTVGPFNHPSNSSTTATGSLAPASHRPHFILPPQPTSPPKPSKPLPEIFSPSRKHGKYIPNGLASTMTSWIIETANTGFAAQERSTGGGVVWGQDREDGVKLRVRIRDVSTGAAPTSQGESNPAEVQCFTGGVVFARGDAEPGLYNASRAGSTATETVETRLLLAGLGGARGAGSVRIRPGGVVGVRAPLWDVDVGGETWVVGVDWVVLS